MDYVIPVAAIFYIFFIFPFCEGMKVRKDDPKGEKWESVKKKPWRIFLSVACALVMGLFVFPNLNPWIMALIGVFLGAALSISYIVGYLAPIRWHKRWIG